MRKDYNVFGNGHKGLRVHCVFIAPMAFKKHNRQSRFSMMPVYFIGIGGIGMSALARYYHRAGHYVAGYDKTPSDLTTRLQEEGIPIVFEDNADLIPAEIKDKMEDALIVFTPAIPPDNRIKQWLATQGLQLLKRSEVLGNIANAKRGVAVAGTHGKTTTSAILAHLLTDTKVGCNAFLGGIATDYDTNFLSDPGSDICVIEADEFDRSFHRLRPELAIITNVDPDHLDIYGTEEEFRKAFADFAAQISEKGRLFLHDSITDIGDVKAEVTTYGFSESADIKAAKVAVVDGRFEFDFVVRGEEMGRFAMPLPGRHNIANALGALGVSLSLGTKVEDLKAALSRFSGVKRRFQTIFKNEEVVYIDDYAHHPSELDACISSARELYPHKKVTAVFQPHLFSRTKDFMEDFAESLSKVDELILLDIYPARELPIAGVSAQALADKVSLANTQVCTKGALMAEIAGRDLELLLTLGAGDIDRFVAPIKSLLGGEEKKEGQ